VHVEGHIKKTQADLIARKSERLILNPPSMMIPWSTRLTVYLFHINY